MELIESETLKSNRIVKSRRDKHLPVFNAGLGANPFPPHEYLVETLKKHAHNKDYTSPSGIDDLKQSLIKKYSTENYIAENVIVGNGLKELLYILQLTLKEDYTLFIITPAWVSYLEQAKILNMDYNLIKTFSSRNYKVTSFDLDAALSRTDKKKVILFNNPTNPTGAIYYKEELEDLAKIFKRHRALVISDEIYMKSIYPDKIHMTDSLSNYYPNVIIGSSLSKEFTTGGWRLGWLIFNKELNDIYNRVFNLCSSIYSCSSQPLQLLAVDAFKYPEELKKYITNNNIFFSRLGSYCYGRFNEMDLITSKPFAAWYIFLDFSNYKKKLNKVDINTSTELVEKLINELGLVTVSGKSFGYDYLTLRYSFVDIVDAGKDIPFTDKISNIKLGIDKLEKWLTKLY